ncbi:MAG: 3-oxoacyl-[acyl-carrier-protein] reductase [Flexistipes sinusarabici]|uniref:3-oxoacyl-[acyl-carrier-protein] reductase n=1 Tax=Flexistipes sinusarabici TaxID=2352 RepID=A0A5D0MM82_FLESI|nr:3-oxoacyl-[acyl-carrier-protein] reductase [Flexistipes sinusarabici]TYB32713.1 MAG: 3-oxoacyl-[acyl-carrier-protein] reductase [Flexistipes sinusarabici]
MFKDRVVLVTGSSKGIGKSLAEDFAANGASVCINYSSSKEKADKVAESIKSSGGVCMTAGADISKEDDVKQMFRQIENNFGKVDILINNAGITKDNLFIRMKTSEFDDVIDINLKGAFLCSRLAAKSMMKKRYGKIINISSVVAYTGNVGQANYVSSKSGLVGLTKSLSLELASRGIRVNAVAPGFIETEMTESLTDDVKQDMKSKIPLAGFGKPEDINGAVRFLASPDSDYITGQVLHVNGGMYLG